jgi:hypothetical protein
VATGDEDDAIVEAVFRYQFAHNASGLQKAAEVVCLSAFDKDPKPALLKRLGNPVVRPASACDATSGRGVVEKGTGKQGYILEVGAIRRTSPTTAEAEGGYYEAGLSASGNTYFLERKKGRWVTVRDVMHWIS